MAGTAGERGLNTALKLTDPPEFLNDSIMHPAILIALVFLVPIAALIRRQMRIKAAARTIVAKLDGTFAESHDFAQVQAADFPNCTVDFYDGAEREARALGYNRLADVEDRTVSRSSQSLERTFVRLMTRADGKERFCAFEVRRRGVAGTAPVRVREFITEFAGGGAATTSDAPPGKMLDSPAGVSRQFLDNGTTLADMQARHRTLVASRLKDHPDDPILPVVSLDEYLAAWQRGYDRQRSRLAAEGLGREELQRLGGPGRAEAARVVHEQMQRDRRRKSS